MAKKEEKTNAIRQLDAKKIDYIFHDYTSTGAVAGNDVADIMGENPERVFKTLVTTSCSGKNYVFIVPVCGELDLKKAARTVGEKWVEMIKAKELLPLTGYIHGGCSPIGMKKLFPTYIDESAETKENIFFSGGKIGYQIETSLENLRKIIPVRTADISTK